MLHACMQNWDGYNTNLHFEKCGYTNNKMDYDICPKWQNHQFFWCVEEQQIPKHPRIGGRSIPQSMEISWSSWFHRIGWWENLQETPIFGKNHGFRWRFSLKPIHWWFLHHRTWEKSFTISRKIGMPGMSCLSSRCVTFSCPSWGTLCRLWRYDPLDSTGFLMKIW